MLPLKKPLVLLAFYLHFASSFKPTVRLVSLHVSRPVALSPRVLQTVQPIAWPLTIQRATSSGSGSLESQQKHQDNLVTVYWTPGCEFCARAKGLLDELGLVWEGVDVGTGSDAASAREALAKLTGQSSVPQIFVGDLKLGGFDELVQLRDSGELATMVESKGLLKAGATAAESENTVAADSETVDIKSLHDPRSGVLNVLKTGAITEAGGSAEEVCVAL